jgi:hypothetical protein
MLTGIRRAYRRRAAPRLARATTPPSCGKLAASDGAAPSCSSARGVRRRGPELLLGSRVRRRRELRQARGVRRAAELLLGSLRATARRRAAASSR